MMNQVNQNEVRKKIRKIIKDFKAKKNGQKLGRDQLIPLLQHIQEHFSYLSKESMEEIAHFLELPESKVYGVATFYNQFRFSRKGKYEIQICRGTACHVEGSKTLLDALSHELKIEAGETTRDGLFSLSVVACIGACGLAPVIAINGEFYAKATVSKIKKIIKNLREQDAKDEDQKELVHE